MSRPQTLWSLASAALAAVWKRHPIPVTLVTLAAGLLLMLLAGCADRRAPEAATARVLPSATVNTAADGAYLSDIAYAEVNSEWLPSYYQTFRSELFRQGVVKWDSRFDCDDFAAYYVALAQTRHYLASWHSATPAQRLALGVYWYRQDTGRPHAIVAALTERGLLFIEPQTGEELHLTTAERTSAWLKVF